MGKTLLVSNGTSSNGESSLFFSETWGKFFIQFPKQCFLLQSMCINISKLQAAKTWFVPSHCPNKLTLGPSSYIVLKCIVLKSCKGLWLLFFIFNDFVIPLPPSLHLPPWEFIYYYIYLNFFSHYKIYRLIIQFGKSRKV